MNAGGKINCWEEVGNWKWNWFEIGKCPEDGRGVGTVGGGRCWGACTPAQPKKREKKATGKKRSDSKTKGTNLKNMQKMDKQWPLCEFLNVTFSGVVGGDPGGGMSSGRARLVVMRSRAKSAVLHRMSWLLKKFCPERRPMPCSFCKEAYVSFDDWTGY